MISSLFLFVCSLAVFASAMVAGVFLAFSDFVMKSLGATRPAGGIEAMQIINRKVFSTIFMGLLIGMAPLSVLIVAYAYAFVDAPAHIWVLAGTILYMVGVIGVSFWFNIPMNKKLERMAFTSAETADYWSKIYVPRWSFWNYTRALSGALASSCYFAACLVLVQ